MVRQQREHLAFQLVQLRKGSLVRRRQQRVNACGQPRWGQRQQRGESTHPLDLKAREVAAVQAAQCQQQPVAGFDLQLAQPQTGVAL